MLDITEKSAEYRPHLRDITHILVLIFLCLTLNCYLEDSEIANWPTADGTVLSMRVNKQAVMSGGVGPRSGGARMSFHFLNHVHYSYIVDGKEQTSDKVYSIYKEFDTKDAAEDDIKDYKVNDIVTVYYNPAIPYDSCLRPEYSAATTYYFWIFVILFCFSFLCKNFLSQISVLGIWAEILCHIRN